MYSIFLNQSCLPHPGHFALPMLCSSQDFVNLLVRLLAVPQSNPGISYSPQSIENGRNLVALSCSIKLVNAIVSAEKRETPITDVSLIQH